MRIFKTVTFSSSFHLKLATLWNKRTDHPLNRVLSRYLWPDLNHWRPNFFVCRTHFKQESASAVEVSTLMHGAHSDVAENVWIAQKESIVVLIAFQTLAELILTHFSSRVSLFYFENFCISRWKLLGHTCSHNPVCWPACFGNHCCWSSAVDAGMHQPSFDSWQINEEIPSATHQVSNEALTVIRTTRCLHFGSKMISVWTRNHSYLLIFLASVAATTGVIANAFMQRKQFYPSVVYITKSNASMAVRDKDGDCLQCFRH